MAAVRGAGQGCEHGPGLLCGSQAVFCYFPVLIIIRVLNWKQSNWDSNWRSAMNDGVPGGGLTVNLNMCYSLSIPCMVN